MHKLFHDTKKICSIAVYSVRQRIMSPRTIFIFVLLSIFLHEKLSPMFAVVEQTGVKTNPLVFPFLSNDELLQKIIFAGVVFIFSDAPFINSCQPYVIIRSNRTVWVLGQLLHIVIFSAFFFMTLMVLSVVYLLPCSSFQTDGWGLLINALSQGASGLYSGLDFFADEKIMYFYSPLGAFFLSFLLNWSIMIFMGMLIFVINLVTNGMLGSVAAAIVIAFDLFVFNALPFYYYHFSPLSLTRLSTLDPVGISDYPTLRYAFCFCIISIAVLSSLSVALIRKRPIEVISDTVI